MKSANATHRKGKFWRGTLCLFLGLVWAKVGAAQPVMIEDITFTVNPEPS